MNNRILELHDQAIVIEDGGDYVAGELDPFKFAELIIRECLIEFYRQYFDDDGDITIQVDRYVEDCFRSEDRLDKIEAILRKQANVENV